MSYRRIFLSLTLLGACRASSPSGAPGIESRLGTFYFSQRIPSRTSPEGVVFSGRFTVLGDTVILDAEPGPCKYDSRASTTRVLTYRCGEIGVAFAREDPAHKATYSTEVVISGGTDPGCSSTARSSRRGCPAASDKPDHVEVRTGPIVITPPP